MLPTSGIGRLAAAWRAVVRPTAARRAAVLVAAALVVVGPLAGCADATGPASPIGLAELVAEAGELDGRAVIVEGHVRVHHDPLHHWLEDDVGNRVGLLPDETVAAHVGSRVRVTGVFRAPDAPDVGRRIEVTAVTVLTPRTDAAGPTSAPWPTVSTPVRAPASHPAAGSSG